ncbi:MAG: TatD family deoxyribonuclease [Methanophagales archaeon ANME-1-THS]|nr:MAG: TatD family deoxyribonuclease [Methanophagales archaeon ANME-1-THS]
MVKIIDIHCHLTFKEYDADRQQVIEDARRALSGVVISGVEPSDAEKALELAALHEGFIFPTLGLHPIYVGRKTDQEIGAYQEFINEHKQRIVGIGEIGLDYHWVRDPLRIKRARELFVEFLGLSKEFDLPVVLHLRGTGGEAIEEGLKIISDEDIKKAVFHCFTGKPQLAARICEEGYYISLPTSILKSKSMKKVAKNVPLSFLLTETDAPYLSPDEEERNVPQRVQVVYEEIARQKKSDVETVNKEIERNFERVFGVELRR